MAAWISVGRARKGGGHDKGSSEFTMDVGFVSSHRLIDRYLYLQNNKTLASNFGAILSWLFTSIPAQYLFSSSAINQANSV
jgi:hypothetical protein